jgi:glycosyltransferase involved in cell wall biosynthesis
VKILLVHNLYRYPGGEDQVFRREVELLRSAGHEVFEYTRHNDEIVESGISNKVKLGARTLWAWDTQRELRAILQRKRPQVVHFHNTFPLVSPAAYYTCHKEGIAVVQSLHNARLMCPGATFYREGKVCQDCLGKAVPWPAVVHACYHDSSLQTAVLASMLTFHRLLRTWQEGVDSYIVFSQFFREKFVAAGLPSEKVFVKPHFVTMDPGVKQKPGGYALIVGRLSPEKGIRTVLKAWRSLGHVPLTIVGDGPLDNDVNDFAAGNPLVRKLSHLPESECTELIKGASFLIWPSDVESFGLVTIEAFSCGTPVIAAGFGAMSELVKDKATGIHFKPGNPEDLATKVEWAWTHPREMEVMGNAARKEYEAKYTPERNYLLLMNIYEHACRTASQKSLGEKLIVQ